VPADCFLGVVGAYHKELHVVHAGALEAGRRARQNSAF
jgi:hypothetical protein